MMKRQGGTKARILSAALELFSRKGYHGVNIREIAGSVGITEGSIYNHFAGKEAIRDAIFLSLSDRLLAIAPSKEAIEQETSGIDVIKFLSRGVDFFIAFLDEPGNDMAWRFMQSELYIDDRASECLLDGVFRRILDFLEYFFLLMMECEKLKRQDARRLAIEYQYPIFAMAQEYHLLKFRKRETAAIKDRMYEHIAFFIGRNGT